MTSTVLYNILMSPDFYAKRQHAIRQFITRFYVSEVKHSAACQTTAIDEDVFVMTNLKKYTSYKDAT